MRPTLLFGIGSFTAFLGLEQPAFSPEISAGTTMGKSLLVMADRWSIDGREEEIGGIPVNHLLTFLDGLFRRLNCRPGVHDGPKVAIAGRPASEWRRSLSQTKGPVNGQRCESTAATDGRNQKHSWHNFVGPLIACLK